MDDKKRKIELLVLWLSDLSERLSDTDDKRIIESTIEFLKDEDGQVTVK